MDISRRNFLKEFGCLYGVVALNSCIPSRSIVYEPFNSKKEKNKNYSQKFNMCGYAAPAIDKVRIGIVGIGQRGAPAITRLSYIEGVEIKALCDVVPEIAKSASKYIKTQGHNPILYYGKDDSWMEMCKRDDLDLIYITTPWHWHVPIATYAMKHNKHVAVEVPCAITIEDCWNLVRTSEETKKHCVILENCCYDFFELLTLNLAQNGFFGDIVHAEGGYLHHIGEDLFYRGKPGRSWRLEENITRNGNLYPTHGLGPIAQCMNINRGNRLDYMISMSSADFMMHDKALEMAEKDPYFKHYKDAEFRGNMNISVIKTIKGQTIVLQHDITTQQPYSRLHSLLGTKAMAQKYPLPPRLSVGSTFLSNDDFLEIEHIYNPPIIKKMKDIAMKIGGHGGMDLLMDWRLIDCLRNGLHMDLDVYDAATWSAIGPLSEWSVANRSMPIDIPDFTSGSWSTNAPIDLMLKEGANTKILTQT